MHLEFGGRNGSAAPEELQLLRSDVQNHLTAPLASRILHSEALWEGEGQPLTCHINFQCIGSPILITPMSCKEPAPSKQRQTQKSKYVFKQLAQQELGNPPWDSRW